MSGRTLAQDIPLEQFDTVLLSYPAGMYRIGYDDGSECIAIVHSDGSVSRIN
jgi:hypothetical protein